MENATLVLIDKPKKKQNTKINPRSIVQYVYLTQQEKYLSIVNKRLISEVETKFGFRRSTVDAIALVMQTIEGGKHSFSFLVDIMEVVIRKVRGKREKNDPKIIP